MLPGKNYSPEDILRILLRQSWLVVVPLVVCTLGAVAWSKRLPNKYRSETLIMVVPQRISDKYVSTPVTARVEDRLATLKDQILSRSRLERIILDLELYQPLRQATTMEDVVQRMRSDIDIRVEGKESFRVIYVSGGPNTAQQVAQRLASLFIEENLKDREQVNEDTNRFLDAELDDAKRRLVEQEKKLEAYQRRYSGQLPSQSLTNQQAMQNAEIQRQALSQTADRERERKIQFERQLSELQVADPISGAVLGPVTAESPDSPSAGPTAQQLEAARAGLQVLKLKNTPDHPDVRMMERRVRDLEEKLKTESARSSHAAPEQTLTPAELNRQRRIRDVDAQIASIDRQLKEYDREDARLRVMIRDYQAKVDAVPTRESDLVEINRDYETLQASYKSLLAKREESKIAANLERRNIGETFRILDPARVPERPFSPDRGLIVLLGAGAGLSLGLLAIGLLEYRDSTFKTEDDLSRLIAIPVLAVVPMMMSGAEKRTRRRRLLGITAVTVIVISAAALAVWVLPA